VCSIEELASGGACKKIKRRRRKRRERERERNSRHRGVQSKDQIPNTIFSSSYILQTS